MPSISEQPDTGPVASLCFVIPRSLERVEGVDTSHHIWVCCCVESCLWEDGERSFKKHVDYLAPSLRGGHLVGMAEG